MSTNKLNLKDRIKEFPVLPGVYLMKSDQGKILYVGKAKSLRLRVRSYFSGKTPSLKTQFLVQQIQDIDYLVTENEVEAFLLEASLIKKHKPRYNVRLTDDAEYPYIRCNVKSDFPRFYFERKVKDPKSVYFGPYTQGSFVRHLIDFLNQNFQIRDCSDGDFKTRKRPCLTHQMGFCEAPCVQMIDKSEYKKQIQKALRFLKGQHSHLSKSLERKMEEYSKEERFEEAGRLRDYLKSIQMMDQNQSVVQESEKDTDVIVAIEDERGVLIEFLFLRQGRLISHRYQLLPNMEMKEESLLSFLNQYYQENIIPDEVLVDLPIQSSQLHLLSQVLTQQKEEICSVKISQTEEDRKLIQMALTNAKNHFKDEMKKTEDRKNLLEEIQKKFHLPHLPIRIECYDISHWKGAHTMGSQVVFENATPCKKDYRRYILKSQPDGDDYASLQEVLERRLKHTEYEDPHLLLIDGGKGQLRAVEKILKDLNRQDIPLVSLAKDRVKELEKYEATVSSSGERFYLPNRKNPVVFPSHSKALHLLLHLRDEAHRFAISSHRNRRDKDFLMSGLDSIKGLSFERKKQLLSHFGSLESLKKATEDEISALPSFSKKLASQIKLYFSENKG